MKIGFFCNEYPPAPHGGIGTFVKTFTEALASQGHEVVIVGFGEFEGEKELGGVRLVTLRESRTRHVAWLANRLRLLRWLEEAVRRKRVEIFEIPEYQGMMPFPGAPCPVVVRLHLANSYIDEVMGRKGWGTNIYWLEKATLRFNPYWIGASQYILQSEREFFGCAPRYATVVYNPPTAIHDGTSNVKQKPCRYVLFVGTVSERKGSLVLAQAAASLLSRFADLYLVYVGQETIQGREPISQVIRKIVGGHLSRRVLFTGRLDHRDAMDWISSAQMVVLPSRIESFALVPLEAMMLGVPVIYTKMGSGPELITDGVDGILIDPNDIDCLRVAMEHLLTDPSYARRLAEDGMRNARIRFSMKRCLDETLAFYERVMTAGRQCGGAL